MPSALTESRLPFAALGLSVGAAVALGVAPLLLLLVPLVTLFFVNRFGAGVRSTVFVEPGVVRFSLGAKVRARDVLALTTARLGDAADAPITLAIAHRRRPDRALLLDVESERDAEAIAEALGAGAHGAGHQVTFAEPKRDALGLVLAGAIVLVFVALSRPLPIFASSVSTQLVLGVLGIVGAWLGFTQRASGVTLERTGFTFAGAHFAYAAIENVDVVGSSVRVALGNGTSLAMHVTSHPEHLAAHLRAAAMRAHGPVADEAVPHALLAAPRGDLEAWLARVDAASSTPGGHYRRAGLERDAALATLHDADQPLVARAAAARVLVGLGEAKEPIADTLATLRGPGATERARVVARIDDADDEGTRRALLELAELDLADEEDVARGRR